MRTAKEILEKAVRDYYANANKWLSMNAGVITQIEKEINEARKEAIEECLKVFSDCIIDNSDCPDDGYYCDTTPMSNLIKELK